jgi:hypothetical protein
MYYASLVDELFRSFYGFLNCFVTYDSKSIIIGINDVNPSPVYNPSNFDAAYRVITSNDDDYYIIELHQPYYNSIVTPGCFKQFNFKQLFYNCENRKRCNPLMSF